VGPRLCLATDCLILASSSRCKGDVPRESRATTETKMTPTRCGRPTGASLATAGGHAPERDGQPSAASPKASTSWNESPTAWSTRAGAPWRAPSEPDEKDRDASAGKGRRRRRIGGLGDRCVPGSSARHGPRIAIRTTPWRASRGCRRAETLRRGAPGSTSAGTWGVSRRGRSPLTPARAVWMVRGRVS